jgi:hypothetical protein
VAIGNFQNSLILVDGLSLLLRLLQRFSLSESGQDQSITGTHLVDGVGFFKGFNGRG